MKRVLIILTLLSANLFTFAQQNIILKGKVVDAKTGEGVSFAHVGLCEKAVGTVSNEDGVFELKIAPFLLYDTLCISAIGYETFRESVEVVQKAEFFNVDLQPFTSVLQDVIISDDRISGKRVLEKAINRIYKNNPTHTFLLEGYYRDYLKKNNVHISFLEAAIEVEDPGFRKTASKSKVRLKQLRFNDNYLKNYETYLHKDPEDTLKVIMEGVSPIFFGNEFFNMRYHNPIRNLLENVPFVGQFSNFYESNYDFEIAFYTYVNDDEVYVIKFQPNPKYQYLHIKALGEIYVRVKDYAIMKFNYNFYVSKFGDERKWYELNVEYREFEEKMYLKYISYVNYFKVYTGPEIAEVYQYREFFVTDIQVDNFKPIDDSEKVDNSLPLHNYKMEADDDFWNNYNSIHLTTPLKE